MKSAETSMDNLAEYQLFTDMIDENKSVRNIQNEFAKMIDGNENKSIQNIQDKFTKMIGNSMPWRDPNVSKENEERDLAQIIQQSVSLRVSKSTYIGGIFSCLAGFGIVYVPRNIKLINSGKYGFAVNSGKPYIMFPGWNSLLSPYSQYVGECNATKSIITVGSVTIVKIPEGSIGLAMNNTDPEVLLPGTHCRNNGTFKYEMTKSLDDSFFEFKQLKFLTVQTGYVRICYMNGIALVLPEGRYGINSPYFFVGPLVNTQQQNLKFEKHNVLLDGGINMLVEGLLTYQVTDAEKLIKNMGAENLVRSIKDITKAELARVFAIIHLEQISSITYNETFKDKENNQHETRIRICDDVMRLIRPYTDTWGVSIINFQLESTKLSDEKYSDEYESASLAIAKAKAELQANAAQNKILIQRSTAEADALRIKAEGEKTAKLIQAEADAKALIIHAQAISESMIVEGEGRNKAASTMQDKFGQELALLQEKVKFAHGLNATTLVIGGDNDLAKNITPVLKL